MLNLQLEGLETVRLNNCIIYRPNHNGPIDYTCDNRNHAGAKWQSKQHPEEDWDSVHVENQLNVVRPLTLKSFEEPAQYISNALLRNIC